MVPVPQQSNSTDLHLQTSVSRYKFGTTEREKKWLSNS